MKRTTIAGTFIGILCIVSSFNIALAKDTLVTLSGEQRVIWSYPHQPYFSVGSLEQLRQHFHLVKPFLPAMPFLMEGKWVIPAPDGNFRLSDVSGTFSPIGDYVVQVEPRKDVFEAPQNSRRIRLLTWDGKLLWEKEWGPTGAIVTNDGHVIGDNLGSRQPLALVIYNRDGEQIKGWFAIFQQGYEYPDGGWLRLVPEENLLLARNHNQLVAMNYKGEFLWRYTTEIGLPLLAEPKRDPLGRGILVPLIHRGGVTSIDVVDAKTGKVTGSAWQNQPFLPTIYFSPPSQYAGVKHNNGQALIMDWQTGKLLFERMQGELLTNEKPEDFKAYYWESAGLSDDPPRLAISMMRGVDAVFDATGQRIWWCAISRTGLLSSRRDYTLSPDGQTLGIALTEHKPNWGPSEFAGVLLYQIPPQK